MRRYMLVTLFIGIIALGGGYYIGRHQSACRYVVTDQAEFIHLGHSSVVILSTHSLSRIFGANVKNQTLYYGVNRVLTETGERAIIQAPLLPMSPSVRALFLSGDNWPDLSVRLYALEKREEVTLQINLQRDTLALTERHKVSESAPAENSDGTIRPPEPMQ